VKGDIAFLLILAVIAAAGFYSTDIADRVLARNADEIVTVQRTDSDRNAIYLSDNETGFDPFAEIGGPVSNDGSKDFYDKRNICTAMVTVLSRFSFNNVPENMNSPEFMDKWESNGNGDLFLKHAEYTNVTDSPRYVDCIIDTEKYMVTYLRFYTDDVPELSPEKINSGLEKLDSCSDNFFHKKNVWMKEIENTALESDVLTEEDSELYGLLSGEAYDSLVFPSDYDALIDVFNSLYDASRELFPYNAADPQLVRFWLDPFLLPVAQISTTDGVYGVNYVIDKLFSETSSGENIKPSYSTYEGRIYQSANINGMPLVMIYNINDDELEGFYVPQTAIQ